jgi:hypothetical protein
MEIQVHFSVCNKSKTKNIFVCYIHNISVVAVAVVVVVVMPTFHNFDRCDDVVVVVDLDWTNELATFGATFHRQLMSSYFDVGLHMFLPISVSLEFLSVSVQLRLRNRI